jgi:transposase-like protein
MLSMVDLFKGRHFDREIIILCVRWYLRFKLSFRDLVEMMAERGVRLAQERRPDQDPLVEISQQSH